jgi:orotate phosphoribosyltransferase
MTPMWPDPKHYYKITTRLLAECQRHNVNAIAGYDYLGYHLAVGVCCQSGPVYPVSALYVRDPKDHGTKKTVEGPRLDVAACNSNGLGRQSRRVRDHIDCIYRHLQDRIRCN